MIPDVTFACERNSTIPARYAFALRLLAYVSSMVLWGGKAAPSTTVLEALRPGIRNDVWLLSKKDGGCCWQQILGVEWACPLRLVHLIQALQRLYPCISFQISYFSFTNLYRFETYDQERDHFSSRMTTCHQTNRTTHCHKPRSWLPGRPLALTYWTK